MNKTDIKNELKEIFGENTSIKLIQRWSIYNNGNTFNTTDNLDTFNLLKSHILKKYVSYSASQPNIIFDSNEKASRRSEALAKVTETTYTFELTKEGRNLVLPSFKFEKLVIDPILLAIKNNAEYLLKPENYPQLAKLGYMFDKLWYVGRITYGYEGLIKKGSQCEDNPKYKLEMCSTDLCDSYDDPIYGAWGMHVSNNPLNIPYDDFMNIVKGNYKISDFELKFRKPNKTFEEWQDVLMDKQYRYSSLYDTRKHVLNTLLCVIGTEYDYVNGYVVYDGDISKYSNWEEAIFNNKIQKIIDKIIEYPEFKIAYDIAYQFIKKIQDEKLEEKNKEKAEYNSIMENLVKFISDGNEPSPIVKDIYDAYIGKNKKIRQLESYYPISEYSTITKFDDNTHISYINAAIEMCTDILNNKEKEEVTNVKFATKFLKKFTKKIASDDTLC